MLAAGVFGSRRSARPLVRRNIHKCRESTESSREQEAKHPELRREHAGTVEELRDAHGRDSRPSKGGGEHLLRGKDLHLREGRPRRGAPVQGSLGKVVDSALLRSQTSWSSTCSTRSQRGATRGGSPSGTSRRSGPRSPRSASTTGTALSPTTSGTTRSTLARWTLRC